MSGMAAESQQDCVGLTAATVQAPVAVVRRVATGAKTAASMLLPPFVKTVHRQAPECRDNP